MIFLVIGFDKLRDIVPLCKTKTDLQEVGFYMGKLDVLTIR